ncbi:MAG: S1 RNA-binding domain-containing protein [Chloroflexi bacterium]|nr:S1 RNA-binding domain-containing protein [Chloroflexota bacterium]MBT6707402.1 S1 RNA-binding domain-containing protein [Chloroflexota bacterium]
MATADTPDSQVEAPKVETPVEQNNDASLESAAPEAAAPETPKTEAPVAEVTPAVAEEAAVVNSPEETAPAVEAAIEEAPAEADAETAVAVADKPESELTMEDLLDEYLPSKVLRRGEIIDGRVMSRKAEGMLVDIGYKSEGFVPTKEMRSLADASDELSVGDEIIAYVVNPEGNEGSSILSIDRARGEQGWRVLEKAMDNNESCKGVITGSNRGGAVVESEGVQGFVPLSQLVGPARELYVPGGEPPKEGFIGMEVEFKIIELNRRRNRAIFSERAALQAWKQIQKMRLVQELTEGEVRKGRVAGISNFGAFVDLGGADGLIHISELSWEPVKSPDEIVTVGTEIDVFVLRVDRENLKIALSLRRLQPEPWDEIEAKFAVGQTVTGTVTKLANFGAFARIDRGIEGLIHISELAHQVIKHPRDVVTEGDELELKIIRIEPERRRLGLSLKQTTDPSDEVVIAAEEDEVTNEIGDFGDIFEDNE